MASRVTESRSYKPLGISSNYRLIFPRLYITGLRAHDVRPVRRVLRFGHWGFTLSSDVADWSRFSGCCNHHDFRGFPWPMIQGASEDTGWNFEGGGLDNLCICAFWRSLYWLIVCVRLVGLIEFLGGLWYSFCVAGCWGWGIGAFQFI